MEESLFEKLGGETGLVKIIDDYYKRALEDPRIRNRYTTFDVTDLKKNCCSLVTSLVKKETRSTSPDSIICSNGGPSITKHEFNLVISIFEEVVKDQGGSTSTASQLAEVLNSVRSEIEGN